MATKAIRSETLIETEKSEFDLDSLIDRVARAQNTYASFTQEQVDRIFKAAAAAANQARIPLAEMAWRETGMGVFEDKIIKNHFASEYIYNKYKAMKTCGVIDTDYAAGIMKVAEPVGIIAGVIPTTNPTSTTIFKALMALKTRNGIIFSPHPRAKGCTVEAARLVLAAAVEAGAPADIIGWIPEPSITLSNKLMTHPGLSLILATGGPGMVQAAYSSGTPALGVGAGNTPVIVDETADLSMAASSILMSKTFDNGMICASEQAVVAVNSIYPALKKRFIDEKTYFCNAEEIDKIRRTVFPEGKLNAAVVGQSAARIAEMAGFNVPASTKVLAVEIGEIGAAEPLSSEKLSPVLAFLKAEDFEEAVGMADALVRFGGMGHTSVLYTREANEDRINRFLNTMKTGRTLINMPASHGAIGDLFNFALEPSLTLGCGSWGGNSVSENVGPKHLLNIKNVAKRRENMLWFNLPKKVYYKPGCLGEAFKDLAGKKKAFIVTDRFLATSPLLKYLTGALEANGIAHEVFSDVLPDPTLATAKAGARQLTASGADVIIAFGGGSPIDAAKIMWVLYEHPETDFTDMAVRFMDIRKRIHTFPELGKKADLVAVPTTSGTGSEVTPFAVITDETTGKKYPIADYALTPSMAVCDPVLTLDMPPALTAFSGIDAMTHALEAIVSVLATSYTTPGAMEAVRLLFEYLPRAYKNGAADPEAREMVHNAATMAGIAFANAFLGLCHSMAHKLGAQFNLPHGLANALLISKVMKYNADPAPIKIGTFAQYKAPEARERYARLADYLGLGGENADEKVDRLIDKIEELKKAIGIPATIKEAGVAESDFLLALDDLAVEAFDDQCTGANPRFPLVEEIKAIYREAYFG